jgi:hypothetical protein
VGHVGRKTRGQRRSCRVGGLLRVSVAMGAPALRSQGGGAVGGQALGTKYGGGPVVSGEDLPAAASKLLKGRRQSYCWRRDGGPSRGGGGWGRGRDRGWSPAVISMLWWVLQQQVPGLALWQWIAILGGVVSWAGGTGGFVREVGTNVVREWFFS